MKRICFVCLGNIVRSPLAQHLFNYLAEQAGVAHKYEADSAGTGTWHIGENPDARMRRVAASHGLKYDGRARQIRSQDLDYFDLIMAMDRENWAYLVSLARRPEQRAKIRMLREYDPQGNKFEAVPDPFYGGIQGFEEVYQVVERSVGGLLQELEGEDESVS